MTIEASEKHKFLGWGMQVRGIAQDRVARGEAGWVDECCEVVQVGERDGWRLAKYELCGRSANDPIHLLDKS